jgi:hypothetical protein
VRDVFAQVLNTFPQQTPKTSTTSMSVDESERLASPGPDTYSQLALLGSDDVALYNVPTFGNY